MAVIGASFIYEDLGGGEVTSAPFQLPSWDMGTLYVTGSLTSYNGEIYRALGDTTGDQPDLSPAEWETYNEQALGYDNITDPAVNSAVTTLKVDSFDGTIITLTGAGNAQTLQDPTDVASQKLFSVTNKSTSVSSITVNGNILTAGKTFSFLWDGSAWTLVGSSAQTVDFIPQWAIGVSYSTNNLVAFNGRIYRAIAPNVGDTPNVSPTTWEIYNNTPYTTSITDPAIDAGVSTAIIDQYEGILITTTTTGNTQTIQTPTNLNAKTFFVANNDTSTDDIVVNGYTISAGRGASFFFDGTAWNKVESTLHNDLSGRTMASAHPSTAITTDTTNFDGALSSTETTNQLALDRLDDFTNIPAWATGLSYRVGNIVLSGNILHRCTTAHIAGATFEDDLANWKSFSTELQVIVSPTSAYTTVEQALLDGHSNILVLDGTYTLTNNLIIPSNTTIYCHDNAIFDCDNDIYQIRTSGTNISQAENISWTGGQVINSTNLKGGFYANFTDNIRIEKVRVSNCDYAGIGIEGCNMAVVQHNSVSNCLYGIFLYGSSISTSVVFNHVISCNSSIDTYDAISGANIYQNNLVSCVDRHVRLYNGSSRCIVNNNFMDNSGSQSILCEDSSYNIISNNIINNKILLSGSGSDNNVVKNNVGVGGIELDNAGQDQNIITENQCGVVSGLGAGGSNIISNNF